MDNFFKTIGFAGGRRKRRSTQKVSRKRGGAGRSSGGARPYGGSAGSRSYGGFGFHKRVTNNAAGVSAASVKRLTGGKSKRRRTRRR